MASASPYDVLGLSETADAAEVKRAYKGQCLQWHPDKHQGTAEERRRANTMFQRVTSAYEVLSDTRARADLDARLRADAISRSFRDGSAERDRRRHDQHHQSQHYYASHHSRHAPHHPAQPSYAPPSAPYASHAAAAAQAAHAAAAAHAASGFTPRSVYGHDPYAEPHTESRAEARREAPSRREPMSPRHSAEHAPSVEEYLHSAFGEDGSLGVGGGLDGQLFEQGGGAFDGFHEGWRWRGPSESPFENDSDV